VGARLESEAISAPLRALADGSNDLWLLQLLNFRHLRLTIDLADASTGHRVGDDGAQLVSNQGRAVGAGAMRVEQLRQHTESDVCRSHAGHDATHTHRQADATPPPTR